MREIPYVIWLAIPLVLSLQLKLVKGGIRVTELLSLRNETEHFT